MFGPEKQSENRAEPEAPEALAKDLAALCHADLPVPPQVDNAILNAAGRRFARRSQPRPLLRWAPAGALAVATVVLIMLVLPALQSSRRAGEQARRAAALERAPLPEDVDGSGEVDILDAFALARHIESARELQDEWDINRDGAVDLADVDLIARAAVRLKRSTLQ